MYRSLFVASLAAIIFLVAAKPTQAWWSIQSIDTMKYSRDMSREEAGSSDDDAFIDEQVRQIAATGATHVAVATPYDDEFRPALLKWVAAARKYNLHVWYRGNWAGWEGWFDFPKISRAQHLQKTQDFIERNPDLFVEGDIFSACPECENGGPGDPRMVGDVKGYRKFLTDEHEMMAKSFKKIGKDVNYGYNSMNADVARLVMDKATTKALGGSVVIDHYVKTPQQLAADIKTIAEQSGGAVVLGEFGAPIPDLQGEMTEQEQAKWLADTLALLSQEKKLVGVNYWTAVGGTTGLWSSSLAPRQGVAALTNWYKQWHIEGKVVDKDKGPISGAKLMVGGIVYSTDSQGEFYIQSKDKPGFLTVSAAGYQDYVLLFDKPVPVDVEIRLTPKPLTWKQKIVQFFSHLFGYN